MLQDKIIDISAHNGTVDFNQVKNSGVLAVMLRATLGGGNDVDKNYHANFQKVLDQELYVGAYHMITEATIDDQISNIEKNVPYSGWFPPLALSLQEGYNYESSFLTALVIRFIGLTGIQPTIYGSFNQLEKIFGSVTPNNYIFKTDLWLARYNDKPEPLPASWKTWKIWQHTNKGKVPGVDGECPLDNFNGTLEDLKSYFTTQIKLR